MAQSGWPPGLGRRLIGSMPTEAFEGSVRSKIAIGTSSGPEWLHELKVRIHKGGIDEDGQTYHNLCRYRYRQTQARCSARGRPRGGAGREQPRWSRAAAGLVTAASG